MFDRVPYFGPRYLITHTHLLPGSIKIPANRPQYYAQRPCDKYSDQWTPAAVVGEGHGSQEADDKT